MNGCYRNVNGNTVPLTDWQVSRAKEIADMRYDTSPIYNIETDPEYTEVQRAYARERALWYKARPHVTWVGAFDEWVRKQGRVVVKLPTFWDMTIEQAMGAV